MSLFSKFFQSFLVLLIISSNLFAIDSISCPENYSLLSNKRFCYQTIYLFSDSKTFISGYYENNKTKTKGFRQTHNSSFFSDINRSIIEFPFYVSGFTLRESSENVNKNFIELNAYKLCPDNGKLVGNICVEESTKIKDVLISSTKK